MKSYSSLKTDLGERHLEFSLVHSANLLEERCTSGVVRIGSTIIVHLSKLVKARFSILCDVIILVRLQGKFDIDSWVTISFVNCSINSWMWHSAVLCPQACTVHRHYPG